MYRCQICGTLSQPKSPAHKLIIEARKATYPFRARANACWKWVNGRRRYVHTDDRGGSGLERVREVIACADCAAKTTVSLHGNYLKTRRLKRR